MEEHDKGPVERRLTVFKSTAIIFVTVVVLCYAVGALICLI